jgi:hypothetical protein
VLISTSLAPGTLIAIATPALVSASEPAPRVDTTTQGVVHEETGPSQIISETGIAASPVRSFFQSDTVGLKVRWPISRGLRDRRGIAWMIRP